MPNIKVREIFYFFYLTVAVNSCVESFYTAIQIEETQGQMQTSMDLPLIITIVKLICPIFGGTLKYNQGFVIDHVQYSLNLLFMCNALSCLSYLYFFAQYMGSEIQYLYFAIGFHVLAQQLQSMLILTYISKSFNQIDIPKQMSYLYSSEFVGKFLSFLVLLPIIIGGQAFKGNLLFLIYSLLLAVILLITTVCIYIIFGKLKNQVRPRSNKKVNVLDEDMGLLQQFKRLLNTSRAVIALSAAAIISIINIWMNYQYIFISIYFKQAVPISGRLAQELPSLINIIIGPLIGWFLSRSTNKIDMLSISTSSSLLCFLVFTLLILFDEAILEFRVMLYILMLIGLQFSYSFAMISSTTLIGYHQKNYQTHGLAFGLMSMFINLFEVWILAVLIAEIKQKQIHHMQQVSIICLFGICLCLVGFIVIKVFTFVNKENFTPLSQQGSGDGDDQMSHTNTVKIRQTKAQLRLQEANSALRSEGTVSASYDYNVLTSEDKQ